MRSCKSVIYIIFLNFITNSVSMLEDGKTYRVRAMEQNKYVALYGENYLVGFASWMNQDSMKFRASRFLNSAEFVLTSSKNNKQVLHEASNFAIYTYEYQDRANQRWKVIQVGPDTFMIQNSNSGRCLEFKGEWPHKSGVCDSSKLSFLWAIEETY